MIGAATAVSAAENDDVEGNELLSIISAEKDKARGGVRVVTLRVRARE